MALTQVASGLIASVSGASLTGTQNIPKATLPTGSVLQVVQGTYSTQTSVTGSSWVASGLTGAITPSSATSKILITITNPIRKDAGGVSGVGLRIYRNGSYIWDPMTNLGYNNPSTAGMSWLVTFSYLDSPATTSATTYTFYMNANGGPTFYAQIDNNNATIILQEISA